MSQYFIQDPTRRDTKTQRDYVFTTDNIPNFIAYLEGLCERKFKMTRAQFLQDQSDLTGETDTSDAVFYDAIKNNKVCMGVIREGGKMLEVDVLREHKYASNRAEYGD